MAGKDILRVARDEPSLALRSKHKFETRKKLALGPLRKTLLENE